MNSEVQRRIDKEREEKTGKLDLSDCGLEFIPKELLNLTHLTYLKLGRNQIKKIENLENLKNLIHLDLAENQIDKIVNIGNLIELKTLYLSFNEISKIENIGYLIYLDKFGLNGNMINKIENIDNLKNLTYLDLSNNRIYQIENIGCLTSLIELNLNSNLIKKIDGLDDLSSLSILSIGRNQIKKLENLSSLINLTKLFLHDNRITKLENLEKLSNLTYLNVEENQIEKLENLNYLTELTYLYLRNNKITKLENIEKLICLNQLLLGWNNISKIENIDKLKDLIWIDLGNNSIREIENLEELENLNKIELFGNPISNYPGVIPTDYKVIKAYFDDQEKIENKSVKVNILGEGRIGKTQLFNYFTNKKYKKGAKETHGTNKAFHKRITDYKVSLWDFGGQSYHHGFHKLFIGKDDINIVLWIDSMKNKNEYSYWLGTAREAEILDKDEKYKNPLLLVQNIWDHPRDEDHSNESAYPSSDKIEKYQLTINDVHLINVKELFHKNESWSSKHRTFIETLNEKIRTHASKQAGLRKRWVEIKSDLDDNPIKQIAITITDFKNRYASDLDEDYFTGLLYYLEYTENIIRIQDANELKDYIFADPPFLSDWLFNTILDESFITYADEPSKNNKKPEISREILTAKGVSVSDCDIFFNLMTYFGLIFPKPNFKKSTEDQSINDADKLDQIYIVPQFLQDFNHSFKNIILELLPFTFSLKFPDYFHESKIFNFFAMYGEYAEDETSYWKYGLLYKHPLQNGNNLKTLVYFNRDDRQIFFHIENKKGISAVAQELFDYFVYNHIRIRNVNSSHSVSSSSNGEGIPKHRQRSYFINAVEKMKKIDEKSSTDHLVTPISALENIIRHSSDLKNDDAHLITQHPYEFDVLETIQTIEANNYFGRCTITNKRIKLDYMAINLLETSNKKKHRIFFSYSHKDEKYRDELEVHMAMLKRSGSIETWHDRKILAGENWDDKIKEQLMQADIVLLMLSPDFFNSDYIWDQELGLLKQRQKDNENLIIIPIFTRPCDTTDFEMLKYQSIQKDNQSNLEWISSSIDRDALYLKMIKELRKIL